MNMIIFRVSDEKKEKWKYEFNLYNQDNIKDLPLNKSGIGIIAKYNNNYKEKFMFYFVTEQLIEYIDKDKINFYQTNNKDMLLKEFNYKFKTNGNCILFCEINGNNNELEIILEKIKAYQDNLNK